MELIDDRWVADKPGIPPFFEFKNTGYDCKWREIKPIYNEKRIFRFLQVRNQMVFSISHTNRSWILEGVNKMSHQNRWLIPNEKLHVTLWKVKWLLDLGDCEQIWLILIKLSPQNWKAKREIWSQFYQVNLTNTIKKCPYPSWFWFRLVVVFLASNLISNGHLEHGDL